MVRHDPVNERGPAPGGGRPRVARVMSAVPNSLFTLRPTEEYEKLWAAGVINLTEAIRTIEAYTKIGLPGVNTDEIEDLADRLNRLREDAHE